MATTPPSTPPPNRRRPPVRLPVPIRSPSLSLSPQTPTFPTNPFHSGTVHGRRMIRWRDNPQYPSKLDKWIQANLSLWPRADPRLPTTEMFPDEVVCTLKKVHRPEKINPDPDEIFLDDIANWILCLTVVLHPGSGVLVWWQESPTAILERYNGSGTFTSDDMFAPDWCKSMEDDEEISFVQPRGMIGDFFASLAMEPINIDEGLSENMLQWAEAVSIVHKARLAIKSHSSDAKYADKRKPRTPSRRSAWPYEYNEHNRSHRSARMRARGEHLLLHDTEKLRALELNLQGELD